MSTRAITRLPTRQFIKRKRKANAMAAKHFEENERMKKELERLRAKCFVLNEELAAAKLRELEKDDEIRMLRAKLNADQINAVAG